MVDTVIFDMDGLLVDSEPLWREAMADVFAQLDIYLKEEDYFKTMGMRTIEVVEYWHQYFKWTQKSTEQVSQEILEEVTARVRTEGVLMEGAKEILDFFRHKDFKIGLASSSPMSLIKTVLSHFELESYFETYHSGEHEEYGKPHPSVYLSCAKELKSDPAQCLVFEDSIAGLIAAKAAQMKAVAVPDKSNWDDLRYALADLKLSSLKEFTTESFKFL